MMLSLELSRSSSTVSSQNAVNVYPTCSITLPNKGRVDDKLHERQANKRTPVHADFTSVMYLDSEEMICCYLAS